MARAVRTIKRLLVATTAFVLVFVFIEVFTKAVTLRYQQTWKGNGVAFFGNFNDHANETVLKTSAAPAVQIVNGKPKRYNLLINSYMNSGSRFTGSLFGFRTGSFYFYEPLWQFSVWNYYHKPNMVCKSTEGINCYVGKTDIVNKIKIGGRNVLGVKNVKPNSSVTDMMIDVLDDIYRCDFSRIENLVVSNVHDKPDLAGDSWSAYRNCMRTRSGKMKCLQQLMSLCNKSDHVISKVLRLTTGTLDSLMAKQDNLKVLHLFRNPMAIVNSRSETSGYPVRDLVSNADILCKKMAIDYAGAMTLKQKYPGRVKIIFYEDLKSDVEEKIKKLYDFIGMDYNLLEIRRLNKVKPNKAKVNTPQLLKTRTQDNARWWRTHMSYPRYKAYMGKCKNVAKIFNMTYFTDRNHLLKLNVPEMNLREHMLIKV